MSLGVTVSGAPDSGGAQTGGRGQIVHIEFGGLLPPTPPPFTVCACSLFEVLFDVRVFCERTGQAATLLMLVPASLLRRCMFPRSSPYAPVVHRQAELLIQSTPPFTVCARSTVALQRLPCCSLL